MSLSWYVNLVPANYSLIAHKGCVWTLKSAEMTGMRGFWTEQAVSLPRNDSAAVPSSLVHLLLCDVPVSRDVE